MEQKRHTGWLRAIKKAWEQHPWILIFFYSFVVMLFFTRSSPLYVFNSWGDANVYFTMGKGLMNGMVPYRDLFDHKGPLTYLLYGLGYLVEHNGFFGVYLVQSLLFGVTLCFTYKTLLLFSGNRAGCLMLSSLLGMFILWQVCYADGGGSPDEFVIPFEMISLYYFIRYFRSGRQAHPPWIMFLHGAMAGCVLLLKLNIVLFWVGFGAMVFLKLLIKKQYANLLKNLLFLIMGVAAVCLPYVLYAFFTGSLDDFIEAYFKYNMLYANVAIGFQTRITLMLKYIFINIIGNLGIFVLSFGGIVFFLFRKKCLDGFYWKIGTALSYILSLVSIHFSQTVYQQAFLPNTVFSVFGIAAIAVMLESTYGNIEPKKRTPIRQMLFACLIVLAVMVSTNKYISNSRIFSSGREQTPQQQFSEIMYGLRENPTLLMYNTLDHGFYTTSGILPVNRFFYKPGGVPYEKYPAIMDGQNHVMQNKEVNFVICQTKDAKNIYVDSRILNENYTLIAVSKKDVQSNMWYLLFEVNK